VYDRLENSCVERWLHVGLPFSGPAVHVNVIARRGSICPTCCFVGEDEEDGASIAGESVSASASAARVVAEEDDEEEDEEDVGVEELEELEDGVEVLLLYRNAGRSATETGAAGVRSGAARSTERSERANILCYC